jgi:hypothetical protein
MPCEVEYTDEFENWWNDLNEQEQMSVDSCVEILEEFGIALGYPYSSDIRGSRHSQMRELRVQHKGRPLRVLYAFDPTRTAILLIGGDKTGNDRWYEQFVPIADNLYDEHLKILRKEGSING